MILLSHPTGNANSRQALLAFFEGKMLSAFYTTVAWDGGSVWNRLLPPAVTKELNRRGYPDIPKHLIHAAPMRELCRVFLARLGMKALIEQPDSPFSIFSIYRHLDQLTSSAVLSSPPKAVYAYEGAALRTFRSARRIGVKTIYELPIAHWHFVKDFFREEEELQPAFADTLPKLFIDPDWIPRKDEELELADLVIVPSGYVKSTLPANIPAALVRVIPYGAPVVLGGLPGRSRTSGKLRVLYVGALTQRKGISYLLKAIEQVETAVEFTIIGTRVGTCAPLDAALRRYHWLPSVPHDVVLDSMSQHDVLVFPTLSEGFALVILEAMSRGMAVITTPNSGGLEVIRDGIDGFIIPIRSSEVLAEKLELLAGDRDLLATISEAALKRAQECTWQRYRESLALSMEEVLKAVKDSGCV